METKDTENRDAEIPASLKWYRENRKEFSEYYMEATAYLSVDKFIERPDIRIYQSVAKAGLCAYVHTSENETVEMDVITDFLAEGLSNKKFTIEQMLATGPYTMLDAVAEYNFDKIGKGE